MAYVGVVSSVVEDALTAAGFRETKGQGTWTLDDPGMDLAMLGIKRYAIVWKDQVTDTYKIKITYEYYGDVRTYGRCGNEHEIIKCIGNGVDMYADRTFCGAMKAAERRYADMLFLAASDLEGGYESMITAVAKRLLANYNDINNYLLRRQ